MFCPCKRHAKSFLLLAPFQALLCMMPVQAQTALSVTSIPTPDLFQAHTSRQNIAGLCRINIRIVLLVSVLVNVQSVCEARTGISFTSSLYSRDHFKRIQSLLPSSYPCTLSSLRFNLPFDSMFVQHNSNDILLIVRNLLKFKRRLNFLSGIDSFYATLWIEVHTHTLCLP